MASSSPKHHMDRLGRRLGNVLAAERVDRKLSSHPWPIACTASYRVKRFFAAHYVSSWRSSEVLRSVALQLINDLIAPEAR